MWRTPLKNTLVMWVSSINMIIIIIIIIYMYKNLSFVNARLSLLFQHVKAGFR